MHESRSPAQVSSDHRIHHRKGVNLVRHFTLNFGVTFFWTVLTVRLPLVSTHTKNIPFPLQRQRDVSRRKTSGGEQSRALIWRDSEQSLHCLPYPVLFIGFDNGRSQLHPMCGVIPRHYHSPDQEHPTKSIQLAMNTRAGMFHHLQDLLSELTGSDVAHLIEPPAPVFLFLVEVPLDRCLYTL